MFFLSPNLFLTNWKCGHVNYSYIFCLKAKSYLTLTLLLTSTHLSQTSWSTHDYTGYFNISAQDTNKITTHLTPRYEEEEKKEKKKGRKKKESEVNKNHKAY